MIIRNVTQASKLAKIESAINIPRKKFIVTPIIKSRINSNDYRILHSKNRQIKKNQIEIIDKINDLAHDLYIRDIVETNHAVLSGTTSVSELKIKYAKYL